MIVDDLDPVRAAFGPNETHTPFVINADAELTAFRATGSLAATAAPPTSAPRPACPAFAQLPSISRPIGDAVPEKLLGFGLRKANDHGGLYTIRMAVKARIVNPCDLVAKYPPT